MSVRKLLELSVVLQATPAHVGEGRYWYCHCSTFFRSALDVVCDSSYGVPAYVPGMDMMLDSLIIGYGYNSEIFELDHWFESGLSTDERRSYGSICDLQHLLH
jgi:hypothetical protein